MGSPGAVLPSDSTSIVATDGVPSSPTTDAHLPSERPVDPTPDIQPIKPLLRPVDRTQAVHLARGPRSRSHATPMPRRLRAQPSCRTKDAAPRAPFRPTHYRIDTDSNVSFRNQKGKTESYGSLDVIERDLVGSVMTGNLIDGSGLPIATATMSPGALTKVMHITSSSPGPEKLFGEITVRSQLGAGQTIEILDSSHSTRLRASVTSRGNNFNFRNSKGVLFATVSQGSSLEIDIEEDTRSKFDPRLLLFLKLLSSGGILNASRDSPRIRNPLDAITLKEVEPIRRHNAVPKPSRGVAKHRTYTDRDGYEFRTVVIGPRQDNINYAPRMLASLDELKTKAGYVRIETRGTHPVTIDETYVYEREHDDPQPLRFELKTDGDSPDGQLKTMQVNEATLQLYTPRGIKYRGKNLKIGGLEITDIQATFQRNQEGRLELTRFVARHKRIEVWSNDLSHLPDHRDLPDDANEQLSKLFALQSRMLQKMRSVQDRGRIMFRHFTS